MKAILIEFVSEQELENAIQTLRELTGTATPPEDHTALDEDRKKELLLLLLDSLRNNRDKDYGRIKELLDSGYSIYFYNEKKVKTFLQEDSTEWEDKGFGDLV